MKIPDPHNEVSERKTKKNRNYNLLKSLCLEYIKEGDEESPDYTGISMDIAHVCTNYLLEIGEIKL